MFIRGKNNKFMIAMLAVGLTVVAGMSSLLASYGTNIVPHAYWGAYVEITSKVKNNQSYTFNNTLAGTDPASGHGKTTYITDASGSITQQIGENQTTTINIPTGGHVLYGVLKEVTTTVQNTVAVVSGASLPQFQNLNVSNNGLGGDPVSGIGKHLIIFIKQTDGSITIMTIKEGISGTFQCPNQAGLNGSNYSSY